MGVRPQVVVLLARVWGEGVRKGSRGRGGEKDRRLVQKCKNQLRRSKQTWDFSLLSRGVVMLSMPLQAAPACKPPQKSDSTT